ncbi:hypothetical protein CJF31_00004621 [Rutstroemia sp. NJR-2017a BVV2]|nr:hypothetical protein CJF31_00004621 [Rutstroemia sp. NJR-2017a BVV2]
MEPSSAATANMGTAQCSSPNQTTSSDLRNLWNIPYISPGDAHQTGTHTSSIDDEAHSNELVSSIAYNDRDPRYIPAFLNLLNVNSPYGRRSATDLLPYGIERDTIFLHTVRPSGPAPLPEEHGLFSYYMAKDFPSEMGSENGSNLSRPFGFHTGVWSRALRLQQKVAKCRYLMKTNSKEGLCASWYGIHNRLVAQNHSWNRLNPYLNPAWDGVYNHYEFDALAADFFNGREVLDPGHYASLGDTNGKFENNSDNASGGRTLQTGLASGSHFSTPTILPPTICDKTNPSAKDPAGKTYIIEQRDREQWQAQRQAYLYSDPKDEAVVAMVNIFLIDCTQSNEIEEAILDVERRKGIGKSIATIARLHEVDFRRNAKFWSLNSKLAKLEDVKRRSKESTERRRGQSRLDEILNVLDINSLEGDSWTVCHVRTYSPEPVCGKSPKRKTIGEGSIVEIASDTQRQASTTNQANVIWGPSLLLPSSDLAISKQPEQEDDRRLASSRVTKVSRVDKKTKVGKKRFPRKRVATAEAKACDSGSDDTEKDMPKTPGSQNPKSGVTMLDRTVSIASDPLNYDFTDSINPVVNDDTTWEVVRPKSLYKTKASSTNLKQQFAPNKIHKNTTPNSLNVQQRLRDLKLNKSQQLSSLQPRSKAHAMMPKSENRNIRSIQVQRSVMSQSCGTKVQTPEQFHVGSLNDFPAMPIPSNEIDLKAKMQKGNATVPALPKLAAVKDQNKSSAKDHDKLLVNVTPGTPSGLDGTIPPQNFDLSLRLRASTQTGTGRDSQKTDKGRTRPSRRTGKSTTEETLDEPVLVNTLDNGVTTSAHITDCEYASQSPSPSMSVNCNNNQPLVNLSEARAQGQSKTTEQKQYDGPDLKEISHLVVLPAPSQTQTLSVSSNDEKILIDLPISQNGRYRSVSTTERYFDPSTALSEEQYSETASIVASPFVESAKSAPVTRREGEYTSKIPGLSYDHLQIARFNSADTTVFKAKQTILLETTARYDCQFTNSPLFTEMGSNNDDEQSAHLGMKAFDASAYPLMPIDSSPPASVQPVFINASPVTSHDPLSHLPGAQSSAAQPSTTPKANTRAIARLSDLSDMTTANAEQNVMAFSNGWSHQDITSATVLNPSMNAHLQPGCLQVEFNCSHCTYRCYGTARIPIVLCHGCGVGSNIRYCSVACLLADSLAHSSICMQHPDVLRSIVPPCPEQYLYLLDPIISLNGGFNSPEYFRQRGFAMYCRSGQFPQLLRAWARKNSLVRTIDGHDLGESLNKTGHYFIFKSRATGDGYRWNPDSTVLCTIKFTKSDVMRQVFTRCINACFIGCELAIKEFLFRLIRNCISDEDSFDCYPHSEERTVVLAEFHHQFRREFNFDADMQVNPSDSFEFGIEWPVTEALLDDLEMNHPMLQRWKS